MDHILRVHVSYRLNDAGKDLFDLIFILDSLARHFSDVLVQVVSVDIFHDDGDLVAGVNSIIKSHNAGVVQPAKDVNFLLEGLYPLIVLQKLAPVILLDCHLLMCALDDTALHCAKGSLSYQYLDVIVFKSRQVGTIQRYGTHVTVGRAPMLSLILFV